MYFQNKKQSLKIVHNAIEEEMKQEDLEEFLQDNLEAVAKASTHSPSLVKCSIKMQYILFEPKFSNFDEGLPKVKIKWPKCGTLQDLEYWNKMDKHWNMVMDISQDIGYTVGTYYVFDLNVLMDSHIIPKYLVRDTSDSLNFKQTRKLFDPGIMS